MAEDIRNMKSVAGVKEFEKQYKLPDCVLLDSEYCSMGRMIGNKACNISGYTYYDAVILLELVPEENVTIEEVKAFEKKLRRADITKEEIVNDPDYGRITHAFDVAIDRALSKGKCLIHDRATREMIEARGYSCVTVLMYNDNIPSKIVRARVSPLYEGETDDQKVIAGIQEEDNIRINYHKAHSDTAWGDKYIYDLCINSEALGLDYSATLLSMLMKNA